MDKILINIKVLYIHLKLLIRPTENNNFPLSNSVSSIEQCIISKRANIEKQVIANKKTLISSFHLSSSNNHGLQLQLLDRSIPISYFITRVTYPRNIPMQGINKGSNSKNWGGSRGDNTHTHTTSSPLPWNRNGVETGGGPLGSVRCTRALSIRGRKAYGKIQRLCRRGWGGPGPLAGFKDILCRVQTSRVNYLTW